MIRPTAFFSSHSDETTLGADHAHRLPSQCARRQNRPAMAPIPAEPVDHPLSHRVRQKSYASVVVLHQRGSRSRPIAVFHPPDKARKSRLVYVSILPLSTAFKTPGALLPRDIERVMCLYLCVKHASCGQAELIWESGRKPVPHRRKPKN